ncbi:damage-inducible protein DinB, partial [Butyricicoccus sp. 1XD8-22]
MYRKLDDFIQEWQHSSKGTIFIFEAITDEKKSFEIVEGHNSLEWLSWHLTNSPAYFMSLIGLTLKVNLNPTEVPQTMKEITETYKQVSESVVQTVKEGLTDDELLKEVDNHG